MIIATVTTALLKKSMDFYTSGSGHEFNDVPAATYLNHILTLITSDHQGALL